MTMDPEDAPDAVQELTVEFVEGNPVAVDGEALGPVALLTRLNNLAGEHGVGRIDIVENRFVGIKNRGVYETPGGTVLHAARKAIESITLDREVLRIRDQLSRQYAQIVYNGFWYSPERVEVQKMMDSVQKRVTGEARLVLYKGSARVVGRRSPNSLYREDVATFEAEDVIHQGDAEGFINFNALRILGYGEGE